MSKHSTRVVSPATVYMPLSSAFLCQDCNCVSNCNRQCPACASEVTMALAPVLDRKEAQNRPAVAQQAGA